MKKIIISVIAIVAVASLGWSQEQVASQAKVAQPTVKQFFPNHGGHGYDGGYRRVECRAYDNGWEEHYGGHGNGSRDPREACARCVKPGGPHDSCRFECFTPAYRCTARWNPAEPQNGTVYGSTYGGSEYQSDRFEDRYDAERNARDKCERSHWGEKGYCNIKDCEQNNETVDSGSCR